MWIFCFVTQSDYLLQCSFYSNSQVQQIVDNMMVLAASSTKEKLQAFEALLNEMNKSGDIISGVAQVIISIHIMFVS